MGVMTFTEGKISSVTRGYGLLETFLAKQRATLADRLVPARFRDGRILDIGCGCRPYFLTRTAFARKWGVDKVVDEAPAAARAGQPSIHLAHFDINTSNRLPFDSEWFDVVTMLAVLEHIPADRLVLLIDEIERILRPGGAYILTTPAGWTGPILTMMKSLRLVSPVEIDEHQDSYSHAKIRRLFQQTRLADMPIRMGSFELFMNTWVMVVKDVSTPVALGDAGSRGRRRSVTAAWEPVEVS